MKRCANCGVSDVPLIMGLDGELHCINCGCNLLNPIIKTEEANDKTRLDPVQEKATGIEID